MCHDSCLSFGSILLTKSVCFNKKILEVGSLNINGSLRTVIMPFSPLKYVGVDIIPGKGVDSICSATDLISTFGKNSFDIVISTELIEHTFNWKSVISNIKGVCKCYGFILITTRSKGFFYHPFPDDFWRYSLSDFEFIFSDFKTIKLLSDPQCPGVLLFAKKPPRFSEVELSDYTVFRIKSP